MLMSLTVVRDIRLCGLLTAEQLGQEARLLLLGLVALAALCLWHTREGLLNVLAAAGPGWLSALAAGYLLAHNVTFL
jgi:hypothetical protein